MQLADIKAAVDAGQTIHWSNTGYVVIKDSLGQYLIRFKPNGHCIGLTNQAGDKLNGQPEDFFLSDATTSPSSDEPFLEEITVTAQLIYACPADYPLGQQTDKVHADLCSLLTPADAADVTCRGVTITHAAPEAETYGAPASDNVPDIQAKRIGDALTALYSDADSDGERLRNALCDLRHFAAAKGLEFNLWDRSAAAWHVAEGGQEAGKVSTITPDVNAS